VSLKAKKDGKFDKSRLSNDYPFLEHINEKNDLYKFQPTNETEIIKCMYYIEVAVLFDSYSASSIPCVRVPIIICNEANEYKKETFLADYYTLTTGEKTIPTEENNEKILTEQSYDISLVEAKNILPDNSIMKPNQ